MELIFVRHGETDLNKEHKVAGARMDVPLNDKGIEQAKELANTLKDVEFDVIISSALKRAKQTAEIVKEHFDAPLEIVEQFGERDFGSLSGKTWDGIGKATGLGKERGIEVDLMQEFDYSAYGGQSAEDVKKNLIEGLSLLKEKYPNKKLLVVAHGGVIRLMHHLYTEKMEDEHLRPRNTSIHYFSL